MQEQPGLENVNGWIKVNYKQAVEVSLKIFNDFTKKDKENKMKNENQK